MKANELKLCGLAAVRAQFAADAGAIRCLFFDAAMGRRIGSLCQVLARARKAYRCVEPRELEKIGGTVHHGGIVAVIAAPKRRTPTAADVSKWFRARDPLLLLDRVGNAHNLGALARTAAFFGLPRMVIADAAEAAKLSPAAHRVAEGGLAHVEVWTVPDLAAFARELALVGYEVIGAATRGGRPDVPIREGSAVALVLGNEEDGLAPEVASACSRLVTLPGSGHVESLNVSVAGAVLLWELVARRALPSRGVRGG